MLIFKQHFSKISFIWDETEPNPYWFCLGLSKYIIVTGDSISMTSESISNEIFGMILLQQILHVQNSKILRKVIKNVDF